MKRLHGQGTIEGRSVSGACFSRSTSAARIFSIRPVDVSGMCRGHVTGGGAQLFSTRPAMLPLPSMRDTNDLTSKSSKSSTCSPVPMCLPARRRQVRAAACGLARAAT